MNRRSSLRKFGRLAGVVVVGSVIGVACGPSDPSDHGTHTETTPAGGHPQTAPASASAEHGDMKPGDVHVDPRRQQLIGVTYATVERLDLEQSIRAVGSVTYDESRLTDVSLKFSGWVEELHVDETGALVRRGQELLTIYSPDLVSTQEEYLTAYDYHQSLSAAGSTNAAQAAERLLAAARQRLRYWDIADVHMQELERDRKVVRALPVHSPASGYVIEKDVIAGAHVMAGRRLYRLANLDRVWVLADVYEYELPHVQLGQKAVVTLPYLPGRELTGEVTYIYPYLNAKGRTVKVRIQLPNPGHELKVGMYADVTLGHRHRDVLAVPREAVIDSGERRIVFLAREEGRFEPREVRVGALVGDHYEVLDGLEVGDRIVASGNFLIDSESQLAAGMGQMQH